MRKVWNSVVRNWQTIGILLVAVVGWSLQLGHATLARNLVLAIGAIIVMLPFISIIFKDFRSGNYAVNVLPFIAIAAALLLQRFWVALAIVGVLIIDAWLQTFLQTRVRQPVNLLRTGIAKTAHSLRGRKVIDIAAEALQPGDKFIVQVGEVVPADATIIEGSSEFNESLLTGQTNEVTRTLGQLIMGGTTNVGQAVTAKAVSNADSSQFQRLLTIATNGSVQQTPFIRTANSFSIAFTVVALVIAGTAWLLSGQAIRFLQVMVVATPLPLLTAAPLALIAGMTRAIRHGIFIRSGTAVQTLAEAETFAFNKTGTLSTGAANVTTITALQPYGETEVLGFAASLEQASTHRLARAIVQAAQARHFSFARAKHIQEFPGAGLKAVLQAKEIMVGSLAFLQTHDISIAEKYRVAPTGAVYVAINGELAGVIYVDDKPKTESTAVLQQLKKLGARSTTMLTSDSTDASQAVAEHISIDEVIADASASDKLHALEHIRQRPLVFVGDGVDDAALLTAADMGIALGAQTSATASEAAGITIMSSDIKLVATAADLAHRSFSRAKRCIIFGSMLSLGLMLGFATGKVSALLGVLVLLILNTVVMFYASSGDRVASN